jgi:hypothetical protein
MGKIFDNRAQVSLGNAPALVITLVVIGIVIGLGAIILQKFKTNINKGVDENSTAVNATQSAIEGIKTFADFQSVIAIVLVAALILGLVGLIAFVRGQ